MHVSVTNEMCLVQIMAWRGISWNYYLVKKYRNMSNSEELVWLWRFVGWYAFVIISWLVSNVYFNFIIQDSLYDIMDTRTIRHCTLVSCTPTQSVGLFFGLCVVLVLSVIMCSFYKFLDIVLFHHDSCDYHWILWTCFLFWTRRLCLL